MAEVKDFFGAVGERAKPKHIHIDRFDSHEIWCFEQGVSATIEALKEMMVGEPIRGRIAHSQGDTLIDTENYDGSWDAWFCLEAYKELGADGEEVVVMVFRDEKKE